MDNFFVEQREKLNLTQQEIATASGYTTPAVSSWEREISAPTIAKAGMLATIYKVSEARMQREIATLSSRIAAAKAADAKAVSA